MQRVPGRITRIEIEPADYREAVEAAMILAKEPHKRFGEYAARLADVVKITVQPTKGNWQAWWTVATRAFNFLYKGHTIDVAKAMASALAAEMGLRDDLVEDLVEAIHANLPYILGQKPRPTLPVSEAGEKSAQG